MRKIVIGVGIGLAAAVLLVGGYFISKSMTPDNKTVVNVSNLQQQIVSIGELATIEYNYRNVVALKDSRQIKGWNIPLTQKSFMVVVEGTMKIGIDTSGILIDAPEESQTISITIPRAKILSHEIHEDTVQVFDEKSGLFNRISIEDWTTLAAIEKQAMVDKVSETDIFTRAENDAAKMLQAFIEGIVPVEYAVNVTVDASP